MLANVLCRTVMTLCLLALTAAPAGVLAAPQLYPFYAGGFYAAPSPIPDLAPGTLLRYQFAGVLASGALVHRLMYVSRTVDGQPTVVTGVVAAPALFAPASGWPIVSNGRGSTGLADDCSLSANVNGLNFMAVEFAGVATVATGFGYVYVSTDYEGLGGPGRHPFLVGVSEGRAVLDAARAVRQLPGLRSSNALALTGYSQGGDAALWAQQIAGDWAPEFALIGTFAGAPASEKIELLRNSVLSGAYAVHVAGGFAAAYPWLDTDSVLTGSGAAFLAASDRTCTPPTGDGPWLSQDITTLEPWAGLLDANTVGASTGSGPILIVHSTQDANIPIEQSRHLLERLCRGGQPVERRAEPIGSHVTATIPAYVEAFAWLGALRAGTAAQTSCGT